MDKFWSICQNTFVQTIRQPIFGILLLVTFGVLVLELPLAGWTMSTDYVATDQKMLQDLGLSTLLIWSGLFMAAFSASSVLAREIDDRTALTVISKPVSRGTFVLGKFAGVSLAVTAAFYLCSIVFLMTVRHHTLSNAAAKIDWPVITLGVLALGLSVLVGLAGNYLFGWNFSSAAVWSALGLFTVAMAVLLFVGKGWTFVPFGYDAVPSPREPEIVQLITPQLLVRILLMYLASLIFCAVAVTTSTRLGQILTLLVCWGVFFLGSNLPMLAQMAQDSPDIYEMIWVAPNLTYFYGLDSDKSIPLYAVGRIALYCLAYVAAVISLGIALFQTRQLESQQTSSNIPGSAGLLAWFGRVGAIALILLGQHCLAKLLIPEAKVILRWHYTHGYLGIAGLMCVISGIGCWMIFGHFARGQRWAYWTVLTFAVLTLAWSGAVFFVPQVRNAIFWRTDSQLAFAAGIAVAVLLILVLPKTRRHFEFHLR